MGRGARPGGHQMQALTREECIAIRNRFGITLKWGAKALGVSEQTYAAAIDFGGKMDPKVVARIRARLAEGPFCPDSGEVPQ